MDQAFASIFLVIITLSSAYFYRDKGKFYREGKTIKIKALPGFGFVYRYLQVSILLINLMAFNRNFWFLFKLHDDRILLWIGVFISILGFALFVSAKLSLGKSYSPCFDSFVPSELVVKGVYRYLRHPIYTANTLILIGLFIANGSLWNLANIALLLVYYTYSIKVEEKVLKEKLPGYADYCKKVNFLFPKIFN